MVGYSTEKPMWRQLKPLIKDRNSYEDIQRVMIFAEVDFVLRDYSEERQNFLVEAAFYTLDNTAYSTTTGIGIALLDLIRRDEVKLNGMFDLKEVSDLIQDNWLHLDWK